MQARRQTLDWGGSKLVDGGGGGGEESPIVQWRYSGEPPTIHWQVAYIIMHRPTSIFTQ